MRNPSGLKIQIFGLDVFEGVKLKKKRKIKDKIGEIMLIFKEKFEYHFRFNTSK